MPRTTSGPARRTWHRPRTTRPSDQEATISDPGHDRPFTLFLRRVSAWKIALIAAAVVAAIGALVLVAGAVFLVILPVVLVAGILHRVFGTRPRRAPRERDVIEGVFVPVPDDRREIDTPPRA